VCYFGAVKTKTMKIQVISPDIALSPFIQKYISAQGFFDTENAQTLSAKGIAWMILPFQRSSMLLHSDDLSHEDTSTNKKLTNTSVLVGPSVHCNKFIFPFNVNFIAVLFHPTGISHLLRSDASKLKNVILPLTDLNLPISCIRNLDEDLKNADDSTSAILVIESFLHKCILSNPPKMQSDLSPVLSHMICKKGLIKVENLSKKFRCSRRWIEMQCRYQTGLSPKEWTRLYRFHNVVQEMLKRSDFSFKGELTDFGYYDQSHLHKDFHDFAGMPPSKFFADNFIIERFFNPTACA
jgi:AraC-like DNA-binding protein